MNYCVIHDKRNKNGLHYLRIVLIEVLKHLYCYKHQIKHINGFANFNCASKHMLFYIFIYFILLTKNV